MTRKIRLLFFLLFVAFCVAAQVPKRKIKSGQTGTDGRAGQGGRDLQFNRALIILQANHNFYLTVGDTRYAEKNSRDKPRVISLSTGVFKLTFEEADSTGEVVERFIRVTPDMLKRNDLVYTITFKNDYLDIIQPGTTGTVKSDDDHTALQEREAGNRAVAAELAADMILKNGGSFTTRSGQNGQTLQTVTVSSLRVGRHEVTQRQWQAVTGYNNSVNKGCADCPVENVSWNEVMSFIDKLNKVSPKKFRLPTEAEWAYAEDRSIAEEVGPSTDLAVINQMRKNIVETSAWHDEKEPHPVGRKKPVGGLYDLFGNVAEWCTGEGDKKAIRGGSYKDKEESLRLSPRAAAAPAEKQRTVGFRLVMDAD